ncbi:Tat pathway signal sequence [Pleurostoma richardsiae]|uniref:Tat pathway signal sequence n=1 Tax=Pleurostoma richardsiae TaxID=41990 RepID=A0AA38VLA3_9PEZI|nr:Tat pathway signal sequence [Pleurostoma richardsiae]
MVRSGTAFAFGALLAAGHLTQASYLLQETYDATNFFSSFDFFNGSDPTNGFVQYQSAAGAAANLLAGYSSDQVYLGVDYKTQNPTAGRDSVRVTSKQAFNKGLFIADITHMPVGCGVWPAFWFFGPNWPSSGEIDVIEGVNSQQTNAVTLHTSSGCTMSSTGSLASTSALSSDGDCNAGNGNLGCSSSTTDTSNYGAGFNAIGGGVYAMEWTTSAISVWFFPRGSAECDALSGQNGTSLTNSTTPTNGITPANVTVSATNSSSSGVDPSAWGTPLVTFVGGSTCDIESHFANQNMVFNIALCGDWAGEVFSQDATCSALASTCDEYVAANPSAFEDAYWLINSVKVYEDVATGSATRRARTVRRFSS